MSYKGEKAREQKVSAKALIKAKFADIVTEGKGISAQYVRFGKTPVVIGIAGLTFDSPLIGVATGDEAVYNALLAETKSGKSVIFANGKAYSEKNGTVSECKFDKIVLEHVEDAIKESEEWGGKLNESGELICNPASPAPGPHYYTNMMLGNRIGFDRPLQSTPKSTVDRLGAGSFRAHADTQVLATRWDYLPEENGFPANRQFYLVENGKKIFWSGAAIADGLKTVRTIHSQNRSIIEYELED